MNPQFIHNLRPVIANSNTSNTPKVFTRSNKVFNQNNYRNSVISYRNNHGTYLKTPLINNIQIYPLVSPIQTYRTYETNNFKYETFLIENKNENNNFNSNEADFVQINNISKIEDVNEFNKLTDKSPKYLEDNYQINIMENNSDIKFIDVNLLIQNDLPSTSASESDNIIESQKEESTYLNDQNIFNLSENYESNFKNTLNIEKNELKQEICEINQETKFKLEFHEEIQDLAEISEDEYESEKKSAISINETQTFMEITITPPSSSELIKNDRFYLSDQINVNCNKNLNKNLSNEIKEIINQNDKIKKKKTFLKFCPSCLSCLFPWVYSENICEESHQFIYKTINDNEKIFLLKKN